MSLRRQLVISLLLLLIAVLSAVAVYMWFGGPEVTLLDAVYMAVITVSTVGYGEIVDTHSHPGLRLFNIFFILFGIGIMLYTFSASTAFIVEGELNQLFGGETAPAPGKRRMSAAGRAAIAAAARARWAKARGPRRKRRLSAKGLANIRAGVAKRMAARAGAAPAESPNKRNFSSEGRARLSALAKARWAKARKAGRSTL